MSRNHLMIPSIRIKINLLIFFSLIMSSASAQWDLIYKAGFEYPVQLLNDTGITFAGEYSSGNNVDCSSSTISSPQDCNSGRDFTDNTPIDGHAGFSFTKLDENGVPFENQFLDYFTMPWTCVLDNVTGLVWEVKLPFGIHNKDLTYQWGGVSAIGRDHPNREGPYFDPSWNELVEGSNNESFCGFDDWRVPTVNELSSIVNHDTYVPAIDLTIFPYWGQSGYPYWTASPVAGNSDVYAYVISIINGNDDFSDRNQFNYVRLVRSAH